MRSRSSFAPSRRRRSPAGMLLIVVLALIVGLVIWLSMRDTSAPPRRIVQDVTNEILK